MIRVAIDGSSLGNPGPSGWAWYIDDTCWAAGGWSHGTNNKGELQALLSIVEATTEEDDPLQILCDSRYVIDTCTKWMASWKKRGWRTADNRPIKNPDEIKALDIALQGRKYSFEWVRGHTGNPMNEKADELARGAATAYQDGTPVARGPGFPRRADRQPQVPLATVTPLSPDGRGDKQNPPSRESIDPALSVDLTELTRELLGDETQLDRERMSELLHGEFVAHLPEGIIRTRGSILARPASLMGTVHLDVYGSDRLADDVVLLRYRMKQNSQDFLCAIIWQRVGATWQARFQHIVPIA